MIKTIRRFQKKYIVDNNTNCYIWQGAKRGKYGLFRFNNKIKSAHRVAYMLYCDKIDDNMVIRHKCDNPLCVNHNHLEVGTYQDNYNDRNKRGKFNSKLNGDQVKYIFNSIIDNKTLSDKYNVSIDTIKRIKNGKAWKDYINGV